jgi:glycosyltransferase involved in cell wall biosynthesis
MRVLTLHNKYKIRGGEDESSESKDRMLRSRGHVVVRHERDNAVIRAGDLIQIAGSAIYSYQSYSRVRELIRALRPDIVDIHNFFPLISPSAYYACQAERVPVIQNLHNYRLLCPGATFFRDGGPCEDCLGKPFPYPGIQHRCYHSSAAGSAAVASMVGVHRLLETWQKQVTLYVALSEFCRKKFIEAGLPADRICVKPNFVDPDPKVGDASGNFALFVGRLVPEKGLQTLFRAWKLVKSAIPLKIVGEGPMAGYVAEQCRAFSKVEWLERKPIREVYDLMGQATFLVFPSEWYETFGRVAIEAFAKGTPVLISDIGAIAELVEEGRTGWRFRPGDAEDLAARVDQIMSSPHLLPAMGLEARREFEAKYTADGNYRLLMNIYDRAISLSQHE